MKLIFSQKSWILDELHPIEWDFLNRLPEISTGKAASERALRRLKPDPVDSSAGNLKEFGELLEDWKELVHPELDSAFAEARGQVAIDLRKAAEASSSEKDELFPALRIEIPDEHTESWYSTLNQARLLLNETHDIAEKAEQFRRNQLDVENNADYLVLLAQYEFYTDIQSYLVENRMQP